MAEVAPIISDLAVILIIAGIVTVVFKWLKQPVILGYIVAGLLAGPSIALFPTVTDMSDIKTWGDIGVIFLLFSMGLGFSFKKLMNVGLTAVVATMTIVCGMIFVGYTAGHIMGFSHMSCIFLGGMMSMSSTAIVYKAFNDMGLLQQKFTGIVLGILVVEDLMGVVMLVMLSTLAASQQFEGMAMLQSVFKLAAFLIFWSVLGIYLVPTLLKKIHRYVTDEILLIGSLGLCLGMVMIAVKAGFSSALGAFVMGSLLAETSEAAKIERIVQPVKDLFSSVFFVSVGMMIDPAVIAQYIGPILVLVVLVLVGQAVFGSFGVVLSGQPLKEAMQAGFSLTQVGEFAFIIASLGTALKVTDDFLYPVIVAVSVITTFFTPYMMRFALPAYNVLDRHLPPTLKSALARYASGTMTVRHRSTWHKLLRSMLLSVALYAVMCLFFIGLFFAYAEPWLMRHVPGLWGSLLSFALIFVVVSPFLWGIITKGNHSEEFRKLWADSVFNRGSLVSLILIKILLCMVLVTGIIVRLFNVASGVGIVLAAVAVAIVYYSKRIHKQSHDMEAQFWANFAGNESKRSTDMRGVDEALLNDAQLHELHLADFTIAPECAYVGQTLKEAALRTHYQVNVISITRGERRIDIPEGNEHLYPCDRITVVGTDDQLSDLRKALEQCPNAPSAPAATARGEMKIEHVQLEPGSPLAGQTIRQADITDCIILAIGRPGGNLSNPSPDTVLSVGDTLWLVGKSEAIRRIA